MVSSTDAGGDIGYDKGMTKETKAQAAARAERLAKALRANLRKRKEVGGTADPLEDQHTIAAANPLGD